MKKSVICEYISILAISLLTSLHIAGQETEKGQLADVNEADSIALLHGFAVGFDLAGVVQYALADYGQYEGQLRINLRDQYFPVLEVGLGLANHKDDVTLVSYKTTAPYFRLGMDVNMMRDKHDDYRIYLGGRYAFTYYKYDVAHPPLTDPLYRIESAWGGEGMSCYSHWLELSAGVDAKIWGPFHLGWSVRYRKRLFHDNGPLNDAWYVPGFGLSGNSAIGYTFTASVDI